MKTKLFFFGLLTSLIYFACEDSAISEIGNSILPDEDIIETRRDTIPVSLQTVKTDAIYAKTISGTLGEYYDPTFGTLNAGFACQFYPSIGFQNIDNLVGGKIDSVYLDIYYSYIGDSLTPMELTVFPINKPLEKNYYTNVDPELFADMSRPLAKYAYTAKNPNIPDYNLYGRLSVPMPAEWGQTYVDAIRTDSIDKNKDQFISRFQGLYIKSTFGSGCLLYVGNSSAEAYAQIRIHYRTREEGTAHDGGDSIRKRYAYWAVTKEVIQINAYKNTYSSGLLQNDTAVYIKSPAGVFTELTIPIPKIIESVGKRQFSSVKLSLNAYPQSEWSDVAGLPGVGEYTTSANVVSRLLLIPPDSTKNFFERQAVADNITSYIAKLSTATYTYDFNNISNLVRYAIDHKPDEDLKLLLIPVRVGYAYNTNTYSFVDYTTAYDLYPTGVALHRNDRKITIIAADLEINK
ncbi:MAG: DUF4270 domain-containing protein [Dysgonamonadaceae bacterium]|jgi:hypothetical protein|nr:DUF4270 domain-containing protein [Dysgonamonadaceae bacterium]